MFFHPLLPKHPILRLGGPLSMVFFCNAVKSIRENSALSITATLYFHVAEGHTEKERWECFMYTAVESV